MSDEQLSMLITGAIPVVLSAFAAAISWLGHIKAREDAAKAKLEREMATTEREMAQVHTAVALGARAEVEATRQEMVTLGAALGAGMDSGAPPSGE
jgi:Tfp pilus assembly protein PilE